MEPEIIDRLLAYCDRLAPEYNEDWKMGFLSAITQVQGELTADLQFGIEEKKRELRFLETANKKINERVV